MQRIGLIVEPEFLTTHRGVRVYAYSLGQVLARHGWLVDFVVPVASEAGEVRWYKRHLRDEALFPGAAPSSAGTPMDVWRDLREAAFGATRPGARPADPRPAAGLQRPEVMPIGTSLASEDYDALIITNPWMVHWAGRLPARRVFGLVLDLIPNLFGLRLAEHKPFRFAHQHAVGFRYYEQHCDAVLAISLATRQDYVDLVRGRGQAPGVGPVLALPPLAPFYVRDEGGRSEGGQRARDVVLAGCFDPRKGLSELPALLNGLAGAIDTVVVYGDARCREDVAEAFFRDLRVPRVVWHLGPGVSHVRDIYRRSRLLLFPSRYEGLGLPLLEAQLQGCRVATYPLSPMKELSLPGTVTLADDPAESVIRLRAALEEPFDHEQLRQRAHDAFVVPMANADPLVAAMGPR